MTIKANCQNGIGQRARTHSDGRQCRPCLHRRCDDGRAAKLAICVWSGRLAVRTKGSLDMKHSFRNDRSGCHGVAQNRFQRIPVVNVPLNIRFDVRGARWRP